MIPSINQSLISLHMTSATMLTDVIGMTTFVIILIIMYLMDEEDFGSSVKADSDSGPHSCIHPCNRQENISYTEGYTGLLGKYGEIPLLTFHYLTALWNDVNKSV